MRPGRRNALAIASAVAIHIAVAAALVAVKPELDGADRVVLTEFEMDEAPPEPRPTPAEPAAPAAGQTGDPAPGWATEPPNVDQPYDLGSAVPAAHARA